MAASHVQFFFFSFLLVVYVSGGNLVDDTCPSDPDVPTNYCKDCLSKNPGSSRADLKGLANIMLDCSIASAAGARDKTAAIGARQCRDDFNQAGAFLNHARAMLQAGNAAGASTSADKCGDRYWACLHRYGTDANVPKELLPLMRKLKGECDAASDILVDLQ